MKCHRYWLGMLCLQAVSLVGLAQAAVPYRLSVVCDREDSLYDVGEQAVFVISVTQDGQPATVPTVSYSVDDFLHAGQAAGLPAGELPLHQGTAKVSVTAQEPGFLRCQVSYGPTDQRVTAVAAAGFSVDQIKPSLPVPDDFDAFWQQQKRTLAEIPANATLTRVDHSDTSLACFDVQVPCAGGAPVSGYFSKPVDSDAKSLPAILWVHGAGVRGSILANAVKGATAGMLSMDINAHGIPNGRPDAFYAEMSSGPLKDYRYQGREDRETIYFRGMFLRLVRAIDFLTAQPEWNGRDVVVIGHSQGGGQAIVAGGLDPRVTLIAAGVPAICDHSGQVAGRINGWPKLVPMGADGKPEPKSLQASRYVDAVNFASRCRAQAILSVGFIDTVCPPSSCYAAYNSLLGEKRMLNEPAMGHAAPPAIHEAFFRRVLEHVNLQPTSLTK
ncbi:MAG: acetylxylan esterase [Planctomycetaceae bacterium]